MPGTTPTVETAAEAVNARPDQIVKSILFLVEGKAVMVISCGLGIVDRRIVAAHFGTNRRQVRLPDAETVFSDDPVAMARRWEAEGAPRLHVVDLDGAFAGRPRQTADDS